MKLILMTVLLLGAQFISGQDTMSFTPTSMYITDLDTGDEEKYDLALYKKYGKGGEMSVKFYEIVDDYQKFALRVYIDGELIIFDGLGFQQTSYIEGYGKVYNYVTRRDIKNSEVMLYEELKFINNKFRGDKWLQYFDHAKRKKYYIQFN